MSAELSMNKTAKTQQRRLLFLRRLFEATGGDRLAFAKDSEIGSHLGFTAEETDRIVQYLEEDSLLTYAAMDGQIAITHAGVKVAETITDIYEAQPAGPVSELEGYREILQGILSRFLRTRDSINILREDDPVYRQTVHEIVDLLDDELGSNRLSWQVENEFNQGLNNFLGPHHTKTSRISSPLSGQRSPSYLDGAGSQQLTKLVVILPRPKIGMLSSVMRVRIRSL